MCLERIGAERRPRRLDEDFVRGVRRRLAMDVAAEPLHQRNKIALRNSRANVTSGRGGGGKQLGGGKRAHCVGRKITEGAIIPVDVLQASLTIRRWRQAEEFLHTGIPCGGQVEDAEIALDQRVLVAWIIPKDVLSLGFSTLGIT